MGALSGGRARQAEGTANAKAEGRRSVAYGSSREQARVARLSGSPELELEQQDHAQPVDQERSRRGGTQEVHLERLLVGNEP